MTEATQTAPESLEYRTEVKQLLDILAHSLYTDREIFLRELVSNASDALNRAQFEMLTNHEVVDPDAPLAITLAFDSQAKTLTISDTGIGMNHDEMVENLGTIAHSGAKSFLEEAGEQPQSLDEIIGQFGVGFYSVFMAAKEVIVNSKSYRPGEQAWTWRSNGDSRYTLEPSDKESRGTDIQIVLKADAAEFANAWRLEQIVKKHSDYVSFPIFVVDETPQEPSEDDAAENEDAETAEKEIAEPKPVNRQTAIWRQSPSAVEDSEYNDFYKQLTFDFNDPLAHVHLVSDMPVNVRSILFVPSKRERNLMTADSDHGLRLYSRKVLIQERNRDLLPDYLRFVEGVVDSEDLPLNVSREMVQSNPMMRQLRKALTGRVTKEIQSLAKDEENPETYRTFWDQFGIFIKEGVATDPSSHDTLLDLLRFHSLKQGGEEEWISLSQYVEQMGEEQSEIYYVLGEDLRSVARSPHLDYFRANDVDVLYLVDPIDGYMMAMLHEYQGKSLRNIDDAGLELPEAADDEKAEESVDQEEFDHLIERFKSVLGDRVVDVNESKQLVNSPCRLVSPQDDMDRDLQRLRRLMGEDVGTPKKILQLNRRHPIVVNVAEILEATPDDALIDTAIEQLFDNALILEGIHPNPTDMVERIQALMASAVASHVPQGDGESGEG